MPQGDDFGGYDPAHDPMAASVDPNGPPYEPSSSFDSYQEQTVGGFDDQQTYDELVAYQQRTSPPLDGGRSCPARSGQVKSGLDQVRSG